jgi:hypothetical protein
LGCKQLPNYILSKENPEINKTRKATLLSAFFGLDNAMPQYNTPHFRDQKGALLS